MAAFLALGLKNGSPTRALGAHLLLHGVANRQGRIDVLKLNPIDLNAPLIGGIVKDGTQLRINGVAAAQALVKVHLSHHVAQGGLGELLNGVGQVANLINGLKRVNNLKIDQGVDLGDHVVAGNNVLLGEVVDVLAQVNAVLKLKNADDFAVEPRLGVAPVNLPRTINNRNNNVDARLQRAVVLAKALDEHGFGLLHDANSLAEKHHNQYRKRRKEDEGIHILNVRPSAVKQP